MPKQPGLSRPCIPFHHTRVWHSRPGSNRQPSDSESDVHPLHLGSIWRPMQESNPPSLA